ncbi:Beta-amyloid-like protein [Melipona quadrifasciata]|uniref:Beta-amyloid-like protein n=1 Tax=Melipona quadrifasciata TaxID=166423 RepID=A0A0N0BKP0_9HYME|nr:Beta-amyloid-like protein [Melipona quadrifasciata]
MKLIGASEINLPNKWNATAADTCRERNMNLRSFAMLLPCGISLFSGVEFVCCPKHLKESLDSLVSSYHVSFIDPFFCSRTNV